MTEETFTFRVDSDLKRQFMAAAKARDRSTSQLLRDFMRMFVQQEHDLGEYDTWFRRQVQAGLDSANSGDLLPHDAIEAEMAARRAATLRRLKSSG